MLSLILQAGLVVKITLLLLLLASILSISVIINKMILFSVTSSRMSAFERDFDQLDSDELYQKYQEIAQNPLSSSFIACTEVWHRFGKALSSKDHRDGAALFTLKEQISWAMNSSSGASLSNLGSGLGFLANISSSAPFVGLFGTVFGIMTSFEQIVESKSTGLMAVAPGIAESLFATAAGLFVAIPALFFYNVFTVWLNNIEDRLQNFSSKLLVLTLSRTR